MIQPRVELERADWEITAVALRCDYIGDAVTVIVNRDWLAKCSWCLKYKLNTSKKNKGKIEKAIKQRIDKCVGFNFPVVTGYRDKLIEEEFRKT